MVSLTSRDDLVESFVTANTVDLAWYGDDPRFLARVTPAQLISLLDSPSVLFVEPDYPITNFMSDSAADVRARTAGADGVYSFDPTSGSLGRLVSNVPGLTAEEVTGAGVRVAITDSGIDKTHRDFGGWDCTPGPYQPCESRIVETVTTDHLVPGFESSDALPTTEAASGHGTHVAGTIAGNGYYTRDGDEDQPRYGGDGYVIGIAPNAELISVKNGDSQWAGLSSFALQWQLDNAAELGIKGSSNSWGCLGGCSFNGSSATGQLLRDLYNAGVVVTFAVGNDGGGSNGAAFSGNAQSPYVLGVASYDDANDQLASTSSRGESSAPLYDAVTWTPESEPVNGTRRPDVAAPGVNIWSARSLTGGTSTGEPRINSNDATGGRSAGFVPYDPLSGTSMATPHVSGAAAVLFGACPVATPLDVMRAIIAGANGTKVKKTGGPGSAAAPFEVGYGGLDVRASLDRLLTLEVCGGDGDPDPDPTPTPTPTSSPSPNPTTSPGADATYYFHSGSGSNNLDHLDGSTTFDAMAPTSGEPANAIDVPGLQNVSGNEVVDPVWRGELDESATSLTVDFWGRTLPDEAIGSVDYTVRVSTGGEFFELVPSIRDTVPVGSSEFVRITHTFDKMVEGDQEVPLSLPTGPFTIAVRGTFTVDNAATEIRFDSVDFPSGFSTSGGASPDPTPTPTPTPSITPAPVPVSDPFETFEEVARLEPPMGMTGVVATLPGGPEGSFIRIMQLGGISLVGSDGLTLWHRSATSFRNDWNLPSELWLFPRNHLQQVPMSTLHTVNDRPYAASDLNGDGIAELVVAFSALGTAERPTRGGLAILDGRDGNTLWATTFEGSKATHVAVHAGHVLVALEVSGESEVRAYSVDPAPENLQVELAWRRVPQGVSTPVALEPLSADGVAVAWGITPNVNDPSSPGRLEVLDMATGEPRWNRDVPGGVGALRFDRVRQEVVLVEDTLSGHVIRALGEAGGDQRLQLDVESARLENIHLADLDGDGAAEWVTAGRPGRMKVDVAGQVEITGDLDVAGVVTAWDAETGTRRWAHVLQTPPDPLAPGPQEVRAIPALQAVPTSQGIRVIVGVFQTPLDEKIVALDGTSGDPMWQNNHPQEVVFPTSFAPYEVGDTPAILGMTARQVGRALAVEDGRVLLDEPLYSQIYAVDTTDVNNDGVTDLVVGMESGGIWALDGTALIDEPRVLWHHKAVGAINQLRVGDLDGDGGDDVVYGAALTQGEEQKDGGYKLGSDTDLIMGEVGVLDATDGASRWRQEFPQEYVWSFTIGDVDEDGDEDVVVPTRSLTAIDGPSGETLWAYRVAQGLSLFSNAEIAPGPRVAAQFMLQGPTTPWEARHNVTGAPYKQTSEMGYTETPHVVAVVVDGRNGTEQWNRPIVAEHTSAMLRGGVATGPHIAGADGYGMAVVYREHREPGEGEPFYGPEQRNAARVDVLDVRTGELLYASRPTDVEARTTASVEALPEAGLVMYGTRGGRCIRPEGDFVPNAWGDFGPRDVDEGDFGSLGHALVRLANSGATFVTADTCTARPGPPQLLGANTRLGGQHELWFDHGEVVIRDLESDGSDEIIVLPYHRFRDETLSFLQTGTFGFGGLWLQPNVRIYSTVAGPGATPTPTPTQSGSPSPSPTESPQPGLSEVSFTENSAQSGQYSDETLFEARLADSNGNPLAGRELSFELVGAESPRTSNATTDDDGVAAVTPRLEEKPGAYQLTVRFAGDGTHTGSADTAAFVVDKEDTDLALTVDGKGAKRRLDARLSDRDTSSAGIEGRTVSFYSDGELLGTAVTNSDGVATFDPERRHQGGPHSYEARFEGDDYFEPSSGNADT